MNREIINTYPTYTDAVRIELNKLNLKLVVCTDQVRCDQIEARIKELESTGRVKRVRHEAAPIEAAMPTATVIKRVPRTSPAAPRARASHLEAKRTRTATPPTAARVHGKRKH